MRKIFFLFLYTLPIAMVLCFFAKTVVASDGKNQLDAETSLLQKKIQALAIDQENAFRFLQSETNLDKSVLMVGGILQVKPNAIFSFPISIIPGNFGPVAFQTDVLYPSTFTFISANIGPVAAVGNKSIQSNSIAGGKTIIVFGLNQNVIGNGLAATFQMRAPATPGVYPFGFFNMASADGPGHSLLTESISGTVVVAP